jgi:hypothetical protein
VVRQRNRNHFYQDKETAITNNVLKNFFLQLSYICSVVGRIHWCSVVGSIHCNNIIKSV